MMINFGKEKKVKTICVVFEDGIAVTTPACKRWFAKFKLGNYDRKDNSMLLTVFSYGCQYCAVFGTNQRISTEELFLTDTFIEWR